MRGDHRMVDTAISDGLDWDSGPIPAAGSENRRRSPRPEKESSELTALVRGGARRFKHHPERAVGPAGDGKWRWYRGRTLSVAPAVRVLPPTHHQPPIGPAITGITLPDHRGMRSARTPPHRRAVGEKTF